MVDEKGVVITTFAASDLRGISPSQVGVQLPFNVLDFLRARNEVPSSPSAILFLEFPSQLPF